MFFWKKQKKKRNTKEKNIVEQKEELQKIITSQEKLAKDIEQMFQQAKDEQNEQLLKILNLQGQLQKSVRKNTESIEDLADIIEETASSIEDKKQIEKNTDLYNLLGICMEQLCLIEDALSGDLAWREQFTIMDQKRSQYERLAGVSQTGYPGEIFDYRLHEILQTEDTTEEAKEGVVAKRYAPGFVYQGEVIKKAKVSVYRRKQHEQDNRN